MVAPGGATTLTGITQSAAIPGAIFVAGYNLGLLQQGGNNIPANVNTKIEGTNTTQGTQTTNTVGGTPPNGSVTVAVTARPTATVQPPAQTPKKKKKCKKKKKKSRSAESAKKKKCKKKK